MGGGRGGGGRGRPLDRGRLFERGVPNTNLTSRRNDVYRAFSLTWPAAMLIYWNKRKHLHEKSVQLPEDFVGGTPIWPP